MLKLASISTVLKFVLCSYNEHYPVIIDQEETRYWVRKVTRLESDDTFFLEKLKAEIPAFLFYLKQRPMSSTQQSRMWFSPKDIHTDALDRIIQNNRPRLEVDMAEVILDIMEKMNVESAPGSTRKRTHLQSARSHALLFL